MRQRLVLISGVLVLFVLSLTLVILLPKDATTGKAAHPVLPLKDTTRGAQLPLTITGTTTYVYGQKVIAQKNQAGTTYNFQDIIRSNTITTNPAGSIQSRYTSYPYGKTLSKESTADSQQRYTYTGKEDDGRLMYFGARYLDTRTGRFASTDPAQSTFASYDYANSNPFRYVDPTGLAGDPTEYSYHGSSGGHVRLWDVQTPDFVRNQGFLMAGGDRSIYLGGFEEVIREPMGMVTQRAIGTPYAASRWHERFAGQFGENTPPLSEFERPAIIRTPKLKDDEKYGRSLIPVDEAQILDPARMPAKITDENGMETVHKIRELAAEESSWKPLREFLDSPALKRAGKALPVVGVCVGLACAASAARAGNWDEAALECVGAVCDPIDYATMGYSIMSSEGALNNFETVRTIKDDKTRTVGQHDEKADAWN